MAELFYIMGASGAGKDTLISYAHDYLGDNEQLVFARRYITRPPGYGTEQHIALELEDFVFKRRNGFFALAWDSNDFSYGIDHQTLDHLDQGHNVLMNGSRAYLAQAATLFKELHPILILASDTLILHRMRQRGREPEKQVKQRIERSKMLQHTQHPKLSIIENNGTVQEAGTRLLALLTKHLPQENSDFLPISPVAAR